jgi:hypothetical protein
MRFSVVFGHRGVLPARRRALSRTDTERGGPAPTATAHFRKLRGASLPAVGGCGLDRCAGRWWRPIERRVSALDAQAIEGRHALMVMAADYPFMDVLWSMIIFFFWVIWIWIVITVLIDVFRRDDIGGWAKAAWVIFVVILPWLGVLVYLIVEHDGMRERSMSQAQAQRREFDDYVRDAAGGGSAGEIAKAKELLDTGAITQGEFEALKAKVLA